MLYVARPSRGEEADMDIQALVQALSNTLDPSLGKQAEAWLEEVSLFWKESLKKAVFSGFM